MEAAQQRALAAKLILEDPEAYGLNLPAERRLSATATREETVRVSKSREDLAALARDYGVPYLEFRELNPQLRGSSLPRGSYRITLPAEPLQAVGASLGLGSPGAAVSR